MRKFTFIIFLLILVGALVACSSSKKTDANSLEKSIYDVSKQSKEVSLSLKEKKITPKTETITLIYTNHSNNEYIYGEEASLEVKVGDAWHVVPMLKTAAWDGIAYILSPNKGGEATFSIKNNYAQLNSGSYRVVKRFNSNGAEIFSITEFEIQ